MRNPDRRHRRILRAGIVDRFASTYIGQFYTTVILLLCAAFMIVLRPSGLLGKPT